MDDISRYIETMNKIQNTINTPEIQAIQKQYAAIHNATNIIATQQIIADYNSVYDAVNALSLPLSQYHMNVDEIHSDLSSMASFSNILILSIFVDTFFARISMPKQQYPEIHNISAA